MILISEGVALDFGLAATGLGPAVFPVSSVPIVMLLFVNGAAAG